MPSRTRKFRGSRNHGRGIKAGRGAGKQGGRGNAGLHKYKFKSMLIYAPDHFGRHGFKRPASSVNNYLSVNVGDLPLLVPRLKEAGAIKDEGGVWAVDLSLIGVDRLLGGGKPEGKWKVTVTHASAHAKEKVTVITTEPPPEPKKAPAPPPSGGGGGGKGGAPAEKGSAPAQAPKAPKPPKPAGAGGPPPQPAAKAPPSG